MSTFRGLAPLAAIVATLGLAPAAWGQVTCQATGANANCTTSATTTITVPTILRLTIGSATTSFGSITPAAYDLGTADVAGPSVVVKANQGWRVHISSSATFWTAANTDPLNPARTTKPLSDLRWGPTVGGGSWTPLTGTTTQIGAGSGTGGTAVPLAFRSAWSYALDTPGNYSVPVTFTLLSP